MLYDLARFEGRGFLDQSHNHVDVCGGKWDGTLRHSLVLLIVSVDRLVGALEWVNWSGAGLAGRLGVICYVFYLLGWSGAVDGLFVLAGDHGQCYMSCSGFHSC